MRDRVTQAPPDRGDRVRNVELAYENAARAARMTGGGFGGSIVALTDASEAAKLAENVAAAYLAQSGRRGSAIVCQASDGARELA
jgi:galactokinase